MSTHSFVSPENMKSARRLLIWARNYLMQEHESINRPYAPQAVCPFVEASVRANCLHIVFHDEFDGRCPIAIADQILEYVEPFKQEPPFAPNEQMLKALLIVFPNIKEEFLNVLDVCHKMIKPKMVDSGLMVGQFHSKCETRGIHNPAWNAISKSPVPLMAVRHMVIHDIIFLENNDAWFRAYDASFGARFAQGGKFLSTYQKHLLACYQRAKAKHGDVDVGCGEETILQRSLRR
jgi:heptaprenyl diphosphate synthase